MPDTIMDRFSEAQEKILQRSLQAAKLYPALWQKMIAHWNTPDPQDRVWLTYSANYIFRTNDIHWAIDPLTLNWRIKDAPRVDVARDLSPLSFVLLTHDHGDHLDLELLSALKDRPITWVVPEFLLEKVVTEAGLPRDRIRVPSRMKITELGGLYILPFEGLHWETLPDGTSRGVPSMGYLVECNGRRWLFPGDTRTYDPTQFPAFSDIDVVFAHLWLGRDAALEDPPPLLDPFCRFFQATGARQVILTHLNELGRDASNFWGEAHAELVRKKIEEMCVNIPVSHLVMGEGDLL
ncbi:MAG: MBL fold metallo-hydrolase [Syntrophothermus sp.]